MYINSFFYLFYVSRVIHFFVFIDFVEFKIDFTQMYLSNYVRPHYYINYYNYEKTLL